MTVTESMVTIDEPFEDDRMVGFDDLSQEPEDVYGQLVTEGVIGEPIPTKVPRLLPLHDVHSVPGVFQPREHGTDVERAKEIGKGLTGKISDERVHVWWSGLRWIVIDGHHRVEGYWHKAKAGGASFKVPVECHVGLSVAEALQMSRTLNDRGRVRLTREEIGTTCWRIVLERRLSIKQIAKLTDSSPRRVSDMRKVSKDLQSRGWSLARLRSMSWKAARDAAKSIGETMDWNSDEARLKGAEWAKLINKVTGYQAAHDPEAFAWALALMTDNGSMIARVLHTEAFDETMRENLENEGWQYLPEEERIEDH